jgi:hypothetical protein
MVKWSTKALAFSIMLFSFVAVFSPFVLAAGGDPSTSTTSGSSDNKNIPDATDPSKCGSAENGKKEMTTPSNCLFLEEPIGGEKGYDLYTRICPASTEEKKAPPPCEYRIWNGRSITAANEHGPLQAILTREANKPERAGLGLLYNYIGLIYNYVSGIIIGFSVLMIILGGIQISIGGAEESSVSQGKGRIVKAIVGIIVWFTASLILYTINPTFFRF